MSGGRGAGGGAAVTWVFLAQYFSNCNTLLPRVHGDMNIRKHYIIKINDVTQCPVKTSWCRGYVQPALTGGPQSEPHFPGYSSEFGGFEPTGRLGGQMPDETLNSPSPPRGHSFQSSLLSLHSGAFWGLAGGCP